MAKRKRLTPPKPEFFANQAPAPLSRAPIADVAREAAGSAAYEELAQALSSAREGGRMVVQVPLSSIDLEYLVRDRVAFDPAEMETLQASIAARGQQTPVDLVDLGANRYGLISGWRRIHALSALHKQTGESRFAEVLGLVRQPAESADAYLAMVEENEIRVGLSYFERARIVAKAVEQGVFETERQALQALFQAASRAKRSKIGSFLPIVRHLDGTLRFPEALGERLGLSVSRRIEAEPNFLNELINKLRDAEAETQDAELALIEDAMKSAPRGRISAKAPSSNSTSASPSTGQTVSADTKHDAEEVAAGIRISEDARGRLILFGDNVDRDFRYKLIAWLRGQ